MTRPTCDVLLATYNAGPYLSPMLNSLLEQTNSDYRLLVRDDGSKDSTREILTSYRDKFDGRMHILPDKNSSGSAKANFSLLMSNSNADYILFADQDDIWLKHKVDHTIRLLQELEQSSSQDTPIYAFTDVVPVDAELSHLSDSYFKFKKLKFSKGIQLGQSLVCPPMLGCASGINRALAAISSPVDNEATGHDWWCLLIAAACGKVSISTDRTMLYRLHETNSSAQRRVSIFDYALSPRKFDKVQRGMRLRFSQARAVLRRLEDMGLHENTDVIRSFIEIESMPRFQRKLMLMKGGYTYPDIARNLAMIIAS